MNRIAVAGLVVSAIGVLATVVGVTFDVWSGPVPEPTSYETTGNDSPIVVNTDGNVVINGN